MRSAILYVDDEQANLDLFARSFDEDFDVVTASSDAAAIEIIGGTKLIGVLATDQRMQPMSGMTLLTTAGERWPDITRMLVTAYSDRSLLLQAIQLAKFMTTS